MNLITLILQMLLAIPLTIIISFFNNKEDRNMNKIIIPSIYIIILSALIPSIKENIFLIVIFEIFIRNFYMTNIANNTNREKPITFIIDSIISLALSLFIYNYFISAVSSVIPNPEEIKPFLWFIIILYLYFLYTLIKKDHQGKVTKNKDNYKKENIVMQYAKYKNKYAVYINSHNSTINNTIYAIMIYEASRNPLIYRRLKEFAGMFTTKETKYGIMQKESKIKLTDEESIALTIKDFEHLLKNTHLKEDAKLDKMLSRYSEEEKNNIKNIYNSILDFNKK